MSIPLDRLYHYLKNLSNDNIVIYRWAPHGSRKLEDLIFLDPISKNRIDTFTCLNMICHDQEPLNFDYYTHDEFVNQTQKIVDYRNALPLPKSVWTESGDFKQRIAATHLRIMINNIFNLYDTVLLCHSEKNSKELERYEQNNFIGVYYWSHALIAQDWFRYAEHDPELAPVPKLITTDFLIYNRAWAGTREYRLKFSELLVDQQLVKHCNVRFNPNDGDHYTQHKFKNPTLAINRCDLETNISFNNFHSSASADYASEDYQTSGIEVVLETLFDDQRHHLTEKALRPIACGRPFILAATPRSLEYLRSYGFKTFQGLINEDYDSIVDPLLRLQAITTEMKRISDLDVISKQILWRELYDIAAYNKQHFFSNEFHTQVISEFKCNLAAGVEKSQHHLTGKWWYESIRLDGSDLAPTEMIKNIDQWLAQRNG